MNSLILELVNLAGPSTSNPRILFVFI